MPNQYANPDNVRAHFETTGPEIFNQTDGEIDYFVAYFILLNAPGAPGDRRGHPGEHCAWRHRGI